MAKQVCQTEDLTIVTKMIDFILMPKLLVVQDGKKAALYFKTQCKAWWKLWLTILGLCAGSQGLTGSLQLQVVTGDPLWHSVGG